MNIQEVINQMNNLMKLIEKWQDPKNTPLIERDIVLENIRQVYNEILSIDISIAQPKQPNNETHPSNHTQSEVVSDVDLAEIVAEVQHEQHCQSEQEQEQEQEQSPAQTCDQHKQVEQEDRTESTAKVPNNSLDDQQFDPQTKRKVIHDLFCNDESFFDQEMCKIEALTSIDDVLIYIGQKYAWSPDNSAAQAFVASQEKRFNK